MVYLSPLGGGLMLTPCLCYDEGEMDTHKLPKASIPSWHPLMYLI